MNDFEIGFVSGERDAWKGRGAPLPKAPEVIVGDRMQGYWAARLPRSATWARNRVSQSRWDEARGRYVASQVGMATFDEIAP